MFSKKHIIFWLATVLSYAISWGQSEVSNGSSSMTFEENLATPTVPNKTSPHVGRHMETIRAKFAEKGLDAKKVRNNEVVLVTIPAEQLFRPNATEIKEEGVHLLNYFKQALLHPESYRVVIAVFSDDTGDKEYSNALTHKRADAIMNVVNNITGGNVAVPNVDYYWLGNTKYVSPNNSKVNRSKNRRVEIYIVPENKTIQGSRAS